MSDLKRKKPGVTLEMDKLVDCPCCGSNACYESEFNTQEGNVKTWLCMTCGYTSNTTMTEDNELIKESFELTAEKGDWKWTVVKAIPIPEEEQEKYPDPSNPGKFYKNRMDMKNLKRFDKLEFMDAAEELGLFGDLKKIKNED